MLNRAISMLQLREGGREACPVPHLSSQNVPAMRTDSENQEQEKKHRTNIEHKEARGTWLTLEDSLFSLFISISLFLSLPECPTFLHFHFFPSLLSSNSRQKTLKRAFAHLSEKSSQVRGRRAVGIKQGLSLCLSCSISRSWGVFTGPVFVLETCGRWECFLYASMCSLCFWAASATPAWLWACV